MPFVLLSDNIKIIAKSDDSVLHTTKNVKHDKKFSQKFKIFSVFTRDLIKKDLKNYIVYQNIFLKSQTLKSIKYYKKKFGQI